jgi:hypothetical protein
MSSTPTRRILKMTCVWRLIQTKILVRFTTYFFTSLLHALARWQSWRDCQESSVQRFNIVFYYLALWLVSWFLVRCYAAAEYKDKSGRFSDLLPTEVNNARSGGKRKSRNAETWAANAFDEWQRCHGYSTAKSIADLFEDDDLHVFVDMLFKFTLQVRKQDGSLYPPTSWVFYSCIITLFWFYFI